MFQFGLFASHIPHLIIAIAYMVYVGTCALTGNKVEEQNHTVSANKTIHFNDVDIQETSFYVFDNVVSEILFNSDQTQLNPSEAIVNPLSHFFENPLYEHAYVVTIFSRPPPFC